VTSTVPTRTVERNENRTALIEMIGGYMTAHALGLAAELRLADLIRDDVRDSAELARETGTHEPSLRRLLRMLAAVGITTEPSPDRFGLTELGAQLRSDSPDSLYSFTRFFCHESHFRAWLGLGHSVRTGEAAWEHVFGTTIYSSFGEDPELGALFNRATGQESRISAELVAAAYDFADVTTVVDVGGGDGALLKAVLMANPHLTGIVFDSPSCVARAETVLTEAGVADRCEVVGADFFTAIPAEGDLYIIKSDIQDWDDDAARIVLRSCRKYLPGTARLLIVGSVLPETASPGEPVVFLTDMNMLVSSGGQVRTEREFRALFADSGFAVRSVGIGAAGPLSIIEAVPV
jgi:hypothetical protein